MGTECVDKMFASKKRFLDDDVVITGIAGRFPECDTVEEFHEKLLAGVDLVKENDSRWPIGYLNTCPRMGFIKDLRNFDASFFGMHPKLAERTDPIVRVLLETSVEAIIDAGICPTTLRGSETAVIAVVSSNEAADWWSAEPDRVNGYEFLGCTRTMYSNRVSFALDLKGPSYTMDSQSSSGLLGIQQGYYMLKTGMVDAVIVAGVNLILNPHFNIMFQKLNMLSTEGKCKVFDAEANGYARSEAGVAILMQRAGNAKRVYATIAATQSNCDGFKEFGCNDESAPSSQISLYKEALSNFNVNPLDVSFVEAHGYATLEGDETELAGIAEVYCRGRESALFVGSVKSNAGHAEPAGGLVSVVKVLLAMEHGILPPNLHFDRPNPNIAALLDGRLQVVDKVTVWTGEYAAINSFGIGGTNSHLILRRNAKRKAVQRRSGIPRLVVISARTEANAVALLDRIKYLQNENEFCALVYSVFGNAIPHFNYRAFAVYSETNTETEISMYTPHQDTRPPVCFVFPGMGSQWSGMGKDLMSIDVFRNTIDACAAVLKKTVDFDLHALLNSSRDEKIFDSVLNSFVGITCVQIALLDVLFKLEIKADFFVGHSIGELACAYADETLTLEQTVLVAYWRGVSLITTDLPEGAMAAVGLPATKVSKLLPSDIKIACYNSVDNVTISGTSNSVDRLIEKLQSDGIFAKKVNSSGYAFHSEYIAGAGPTFEKNLERIIPQPKRRTKRWISTSVPETMWNVPKVQFSGAWYHLNNLLSPVLLDEALKHVPENTVVIEIAPHALLQSILKSSLSSTCSHVGLVRRHRASVVDFLANIGRLYNVGLQPNLNPLYPPVVFPVSRKTPMIQSLIEWDHSIKWFLVSFLTKPACLCGETEIVVDVMEKRYEFLNDCIVDDVPTFPVSGYLYLIWAAAAKLQVRSISQLPIVLTNVQILRKSTLRREDPLKFTVTMLEASGLCEIREDAVVVARANVRLLPENDSFSALPDVRGDFEEYLPLRPCDIYSDLYKKGYYYKEAFRVIKYADNEGTCAAIKWTDNWMAYMEGMLQMHLLRLNKQVYCAIQHIQKIIIDPKKHMASVNAESGPSVSVYPNENIIKSGGIEIRGIKSTLVSVRTRKPKLTTERYVFVPHLSGETVTLENALSISVQLVCENHNPNATLRVCEMIADPETDTVCLLPKVEALLANEPYLKFEKIVSKNFSNSETRKDEDRNANANDFIISSRILLQSEILEEALRSLTRSGFLLSIEDTRQLPGEDDLDAINCKLIAKFNTSVGICLLIRKTPIWKTVMVVNEKNDDFGWVDGVKMALRKHRIDGRHTMIVSQGDAVSGIVGLLKCIRREPFGTGLRCLLTDNTINAYKIVDLVFINQFRKGLAFNVYKNGEWGSYRHLPVDEDVLVECEHAFVGLTDVGDFSSLTYIEGRMPNIDLRKYPNHEVCHVYYSAIYAHDIRSALGHLPYDDHYNVTQQGSVLGHEYSGRDSKGKRVCGMVGGGALATTVLADRAVMWHVPDRWTLEQAVTVPRVYSVAYYALVVRGCLKTGETVYINAGISGLCVACMNVAISLGAVPFIGYNNAAEREYLSDTFAQVPESTFVDLEKYSFEHQLLNLTGVEGVHLIFDTLNSHKRHSFLDCLRSGGRLIEFEKNSAFNESLGYAVVEKNITFHKISHNTLWVSEAGRGDRIKIQKLVQEGIRAGAVKPIRTNVFTDQELEQAFRTAQSGKFVGKVVVKFRDEEDTINAMPETKLVRARPSAFLTPENSYIVTSGLSENGIQIVNWLINRGAHKIIVQSPYKPVTGYQSLALRRWKTVNVCVVLSNADLVTVEGAQNLIRTAASLGPVGGIFHLGHVVCECDFVATTKSHFELLRKTKVNAARSLDIVSRKSCPLLKYFVAFSDTVSLFGGAKRSALGYSCAAMEMVYEQRKMDGYPATVIQIGQLYTLDTCSEGSLNFSSILEALPQLLVQSAVVLSTYTAGGPWKKVEYYESPGVYEIANILGIKSVSRFYRTNFAKIGIEPVALAEIQAFLNKKNVHLSKSEITKLSPHDITTLLKGERHCEV